MSLFTEYSAKKGIPNDPKGLAISGKIIETQLMAYITRNIIGEAELKQMKPTAYLINTARADLVDRTALINALQTRQIKGAALDVFWQEPPSKDDPLLKLNNVSLTPHLAGSSVQTTWLTIWLFLESLREFFKTYQSRSIVNFFYKKRITTKNISG